MIRSAEIALPLLTSWNLPVVDKLAGARSRSDKSTEQVLAETTRPCPRCFIPISQAGGCVLMTCGNPRCQHEFCWLCVHDWISATHDASFCTDRPEASHSEVLPSVERQIRSNWAQQAHDTQPVVDTHAKEVLQRFRAALTTRLESDAELFSAEDADVLVRWRRFLEFYDHRETRIRATAQVVFADVVDSHRAQQELIELLSRVRDRWWLRLSPEDADPHNESFMDPQAWMAANGMTNGMSSALLVPALRLPALPDAAAPAPASQQDARVPLPASGNDCDVSMSWRRRPGHMHRPGV